MVVLLSQTWPLPTIPLPPCDPVWDLTLFTVYVSIIFNTPTSNSIQATMPYLSDWPPVSMAMMHVLPVSQAALQRSRPAATSDARNAFFYVTEAYLSN